MSLIASGPSYADPSCSLFSRSIRSVNIRRARVGAESIGSSAGRGAIRSDTVPIDCLDLLDAVEGSGGTPPVDETVNDAATKVAGYPTYSIHEHATQSERLLKRKKLCTRRLLSKSEPFEKCQCSGEGAGLLLTALCASAAVK